MAGDFGVGRGFAKRGYKKLRPKLHDCETVLSSAATHNALRRYAEYSIVTSDGKNSECAAEKLPHG